MGVTLLNGVALINGAAFTASRPAQIFSERVVLDFTLVIAAAAGRFEWYPEFTDGNPNAVTTPWFRETAEEDIGNGDVRMPLVIRRFSTNAGDAPLPIGTYYLDAQLVRSHAFYRVQCRLNGVALATCVATIYAPFGKIPG